MTTSHSPGPPPGGGVLAQHDFRQLFHAAAVSHVGTHVTLVALPLIATLQLDASAFEVGLLTAVETVAFLLIGLPAGAWVDRARKLPVLMRADVARAVAMGSVPVAAVCGALTMAQLYVVALVTGFATVFFDVAYQSYLPSLLPRARLVAGNGALESARSAAQVAGPGLGGGLVQALGAPLALAVDAVSYLVSALFLRRIRAREEAPEPDPGVSLGAQVKEGLAFVLRHPVLRLIAATTGVANFFAALQTAVQTVFLVRVLDLPAGGVGLMLSASAVGGLLGAACAGRLARWCGQVRLIWLAPVVTGPFAVLWPLSGKGYAAALFAVASGAVYFGAVVYNVAQVSYRQAVCPEALLGRMNATLRFMVWGSMPLGALAGGTLASAAGPRTALWVCAAGFLLVPLPLLPLRHHRDLFETPEGEGEGGAADGASSGGAPGGAPSDDASEDAPPRGGVSARAVEAAPASMYQDRSGSSPGDGPGAAPEARADAVDLPAAGDTGERAPSGAPDQLSVVPAGHARDGDGTDGRDALSGDGDVNAPTSRGGTAERAPRPIDGFAAAPGPGSVAGQADRFPARGAVVPVSRSADESASAPGPGSVAGQADRYPARGADVRAPRSVDTSGSEPDADPADGGQLSGYADACASARSAEGGVAPADGSGPAGH